MSASDDILITGVGVVSPIGIGKQAFWESLLNGKSGVGPLEFLAGSQAPVQFGGLVRDFNPKLYVKPRKSLKVMCREVQIGFSAAALALDDAGIEPNGLNADRSGVIYASEMYYCDIQSLEGVYQKCAGDQPYDFDQFAPAAMSELYPLWMLKYLPNMIACHVGIALDARGPNNTIATGDASALLAFQEAASVLRRGLADMLVVGGCGTRLSITPLLFRGDANLSHRSDQPTAASRPFDAERDGMVNGEGAAAFVVETRAHAEARGAASLACLRGFGSSFEDRMSGRPVTGIGIRNSIEMALDSAGVRPEEIDHVNAHGLSTVADDAIEAQAIQSVLGSPPVVAGKSYFGNLGAGGGAVEAAISVLALKEGVVPSTLNYETPDPACPVEVIAGSPRPVERNLALLMSQSGPGQAAATIIERV